MIHCKHNSSKVRRNLFWSYRNQVWKTKVFSSIQHWFIFRISSRIPWLCSPCSTLQLYPFPSNPSLQAHSKISLEGEKEQVASWWQTASRRQSDRSLYVEQKGVTLNNAKSTVCLTFLKLSHFIVPSFFYSIVLYVLLVEFGIAVGTCIFCLDLSSNQLASYEVAEITTILLHGYHAC